MGQDEPKFKQTRGQVQKYVVWDCKNYIATMGLTQKITSEEVIRRLEQYRRLGRRA